MKGWRIHLRSTVAPRRRRGFVCKPWVKTGSNPRLHSFRRSVTRSHGPVRFMGSPLSLFRMHWDHERVWVVPSVRCPAFGRPGLAEAGTPNGWFMESVGKRGNFGSTHVERALE